jgi:hypothetical protein
MSRFSKEEVFRIFAFCVIPTHSWTIINMFQDIPAWYLSFSVWDFAGTVAYTLASVLFEAIVVSLVLLLAGYFLPRKWVEGRYVALSGIIILEATLFAIVSQDYIRQSIAKQLLPILVGFLVSMALALVLVMKIPRISDVMNRIATPLTVLACLYVSLDLTSVFIILIRVL